MKNPNELRNTAWWIELEDWERVSHYLQQNGFEWLAGVSDWTLDEPVWLYFNSDQRIHLVPTTRELDTKYPLADWRDWVGEETWDEVMSDWLDADQKMHEILFENLKEMKMKTLKTQTECSFEIVELLEIAKEYGYEPNMTKEDGVFHLEIPVQEIESQTVNPLRFVELLTWDARRATEEQQSSRADYTKTLVDALLDRIEDLERALTTKSNRVHETREMLEAKIALINVVEQIK